jgi:hypothetical protein
LIDRSAFFPGIKHYSGTSDKPDHIATTQYYQWAYARISAAALSPALALPPLSALPEKAAIQGDSIPFKVFLYDYHAIKDNALQNGDIEFRNDQAHNVPGRFYKLGKAKGNRGYRVARDTYFNNASFKTPTSTPSFFTKTGTCSTFTVWVITSSDGP